MNIIILAFYIIEKLMIKNLLWKMKLKKTWKWIFILFISFSIFGISLGNYEWFLDNLRQTGIPVDEIIESDQISRYELTRLLNAVNCEDCVNTPQWMIDKYINPRWNDFTTLPWKDFGDIWYKWWIYNGKIYYYCVAYVWENVWMRWYPEWISPICDWKFCGNRNTTIWEFLQVVLNIADQYVYKNYLTNWVEIQTWMQGLNPWSYPEENLNEDDKKIINKYANENMSGILPNENSIQSYMKYCMFNLEKCGMQSFGEIKQWYWPVSELNILYDNNIVEHEKFEDWEVHELVEGKYVLETLYNLFKIIDCSFEHNYDCDPMDNLNDNCPNHYNPSQKDTDWDGIGDVCDEDIDGDWILNPIWIVDDLWRIVISKRDDWMDNCLFIPNPDQKDSNNNGVWDACEDSQNYLWMYIKTEGLTTTAPVTVNFEAVTKWDIKWDIKRNFGDWSTAIGKRVSHTFIKNWIYNIESSANWINNKAHASTKILVWKNVLDNHSLQINSDKISWPLPLQVKFKIDKKWLFDKFEWNFGDGNIIERFDTNEIIKIFRDQRSTMVTVKWFKNWEVVAVANMILSVWENELASKISANNISPKKGQSIKISTKLNGIDEKNIKKIEWNWWNEEIETNKKLEMLHIYESSGPRVITQKILLENDQEIQNFLTIYVRDELLEKSYGIQTSINSLVWNYFEDTKFEIKNIWYIPQSIMLLNRYDENNTEKNNEELDKWPKYLEFKYNKEWIYNPKNSIIVDECINLNTVWTLAITKKDICMEAILNDKLDQYKCDMDNDGIPDVCDDDIDWDGMTNLIGLIEYENEDCSINMQNINRDIVSMHNNICGLDNCPTVNNENQMDLNNNWWWDLCDWEYFNDWESEENNQLDTDWDWIIDELDSCPLIPENYNGIEDFDGCPEIWANNNCNLWDFNYWFWDIDNYTDLPTITTTECLSCPCAFSDYANDLVLDDKIRALLWDLDMSIIYSETIPEPIKQFLE